MNERDALALLDAQARFGARMGDMKALDAMRPAAPMPRGPMPTSMKGARKMMKG